MASPLQALVRLRAEMNALPSNTCKCIPDSVQSIHLDKNARRAWFNGLLDIPLLRTCFYVPLNTLPKSIDHRGKRFSKHPGKDHTCDETHDDISEHSEHDETGDTEKTAGSGKGKRNANRYTKIATRRLGDVIGISVHRDKEPEAKNETDNEK